MRQSRRLAQWVASVVLLGGLAGCGGNSAEVARYTLPPRSLGPEMIFKTPEPPRDLRMFSGRQRTPVLWPDVLDAIVWAEVVVVAADPADATSTAVVTALVSDVLTNYPWTVLSLEELDRGDRAAVDAVMNSKADAASFLTASGLEGAPAASYWAEARGPLLDLARANRAKVLAGGVPAAIRERVEAGGAKSLHGDKEARSLHSLPMVADAPADGPAAGAALAGATLADSITHSLHGSRNPRVLHVSPVLFHGEPAGGLMDEIALRRPGTKALTITVVRAAEDSLQVGDLNRADVVIYTHEE